MALGLFKKTLKIVGLVLVSGIALLFVGAYGWSYWEQRQEELEVKFALQCQLVSTTGVDTELQESLILLFVAKRSNDTPEMVFYQLMDVTQLDLADQMGANSWLLWLEDAVFVKWGTRVTTSNPDRPGAYSWAYHDGTDTEYPYESFVDRITLEYLAYSLKDESERSKDNPWILDSNGVPVETRRQCEIGDLGSIIQLVEQEQSELRGDRQI